MVTGQRSWRERARARRFKISVGSNSSRVRLKTRKRGREGRRRRAVGTVVDVPRSATRRSSHVRSTTGGCRASPSPAGRPGGSGGSGSGTARERNRTRPRALRRVQRGKAKRRGVVLLRVRARVTRLSAGGRSLTSISIVSSALRFFFAGSSFAARSNFASRRTGSVASSEAPASCTTGPARVRPTFATGFLRDERVFLATAASAGGAVLGPVPGIFRGSFVAVAASPLETSFKGFFAAFDASRVARRLVATMALPVPLPSPPSRAPKTRVPLDDSPRVSRRTCRRTRSPCRRSPARVPRGVPRASAFGKLK